jgi:hypothetical protein
MNHLVSYRCIQTIAAATRQCLRTVRPALVLSKRVINTLAKEALGSLGRDPSLTTSVYTNNCESSYDRSSISILELLT